MSRRLTSRISLTGGVRWFHLSNNGREGMERNPDIQAVGGYAAMAVAF